ncbi:MAG: HsdM family class I SAM-dependent methyltransferase [Anaerolineae bacterium]
MSIALHDLPRHFGTRSVLALQHIPRLYHALKPIPPQMRAWRKALAPHDPHKLQIKRLTQRYHLPRANPLRLIFAIQTYYALIVKLLSAQRLGTVETLASVEDGTHFERYGLREVVPAEDWYNWYLEKVDMSILLSAVRQCDFSAPVPDALKALYQDLLPRTVRHALGEYYTPDWLAHFVLDRVGYQGERRLLDPTCGSGTFLVLAYRRMVQAGIPDPLTHLAGIDIQPLACLSAKANLILNLETWQPDTILPIYCHDVLTEPPTLGTFDLIVGNPPWINWETLPAAYRRRTRKLWQQYGLFPHSGFDAILGKGKKDLSLVLIYAVVDHYLSATGSLAFIMTQSVLKAGGASQGFRQFDFGEKTLQPRHVDDFSQLRVFSGAETKPIVLTLTYDAPEQASYYAWHSDQRTIPDDAPPEIIERLQYSDFVAQPVDELGSAWLTGKPAVLRSVQKLIGQSDYTAHAGVYTGGANAVYWLEVLEQAGDLWRVRNITRGAKRAVPQVEAWLEADLIYPLLRGRDVTRWHAQPSAHILMVQDPVHRRGYKRDWLATHYPRIDAYLAQFEDTLRERATFKRYFRDDVPFYTMFDIGEYTFAPYKVVWHGFGKRRMLAVVVSNVDEKPIMSNQAMHPFIGCQTADEAHYLASCLNSAPFEFTLLSHTQRGGKSFAQPGILETLRLPRYQANDPIHRRLAHLSHQAHQGLVDDEAIATTSAELWSLTEAELHALQISLDKLTR